MSDMKTVKIDCFCPVQGRIVFSLHFNTIEWVDLLCFVENDLVWPYTSPWLEGIKLAIESIKKGYFDNDSFILKTSIV